MENLKKVGEDIFYRRKYALKANILTVLTILRKHSTRRLIQRKFYTNTTYEIITDKRERKLSNKYLERKSVSSHSFMVWENSVISRNI